MFSARCATRIKCFDNGLCIGCAAAHPILVPPSAFKAASPSPFIDPCQEDSNHYLRFNGRRYIPISNQILQCEDVSYPSVNQPHIAVSLFLGGATIGLFSTAPAPGPPRVRAAPGGEEGIPGREPECRPSTAGWGGLAEEAGRRERRQGLRMVSGCDDGGACVAVVASWPPGRGAGRGVPVGTERQGVLREGRDGPGPAAPGGGGLSLRDSAARAMLWGKKWRREARPGGCASGEGRDPPRAKEMGLIVTEERMSSPSRDCADVRRPAKDRRARR